MRHFTTGIRTTSGTITEAALEIIAPVGHGFRLVGQITIAMAAATLSTYGFGRPAVKGVTPTSPASIAANDSGIKSGTTTALAWATSPTVPASFMFRSTFPAAIASKVDIILPPDGIYVKAGQTFVLWNLAANGVVDVTFTIWE